MKSSFTYATTATLEHDPLCLLGDHRTREEGPEPASDPPTYCIRAAGILRYNRESGDHRLNLTTILPECRPSVEYPVKCEYCGENARPSLDLPWVQQPETMPHFCCAQRKRLSEMLMRERFLLEGRYNMRTGDLTSEEDTPATEMEELHFQGKEMEDHNKFNVDLPTGLGFQPKPKIYKDYSIRLPAAETPAPTSKAVSFRLSDPEKACWTVCPGRSTEKCLKTEEEEEPALVPFCDHKPVHFGLCYHQEGAGFLQKHYSNGKKFLTVFPDGSAQVFYPSGFLAVIVVVTEQNGRVCIVYDDSNTPDPPMRALFQSDGSAACYHRNGSIWLALNRSGGQCLSDAGARVYHWSWALPPTALHPVSLSLNKSVGVRVLGITQVFVSFLARGQQARFGVGSCCAPDDYKSPTSGSSVPKEELLVQAAKIRIDLAIQHIRQYLMPHPRLPKITLAPHLQVVAQRLLTDSARTVMSDSDRDFIHRCLKDC